MDLDINSPFFYWYLFGALFIAFEMFTGGTIVFLFIGLSCITTGFIIQNNLFEVTDLFGKFLLFIGLFCFYLLILWYPIKQLSLRKKIKGYKYLEGEKATVMSERLDRHSIGKIKWSGTLCRATLAPDDDSVLSQFDSVKIISVKNNTFIVKNES